MPHVAIDPFDLRASMMMQRVGAFDPTATVNAGRFTKCFATDHGVVRIALGFAKGELTIEGSGRGADEIAEQWVGEFPPDDGRDAFAPEPVLLARLHRANRGLRLVRVPWMFDVAASAVLQQRVTFVEAASEWRSIVRSLGNSSELGQAFPTASTLARVPTWKLESLGIDPKRARALVALAREEVFRSFLHRDTPPAQLRARLLSIRGVGPWTAETILGFGAGDPDALPTGDLYLPHLVTWALAREPRGSDTRMLELMEPFRGHRFRVARLLQQARITVPRTASPRPR